MQETGFGINTKWERWNYFPDIQPLITSPKPQRSRFKFYLKRKDALHGKALHMPLRKSDGNGPSAESFEILPWNFIKSYPYPQPLKIPNFWDCPINRKELHWQICQISCY
jgi:hypothetical protein